MLRAARVVSLISILSLAAAAQAPTSNWDAVKMIAPGTEIRVEAGNSKPVTGKLESVADDSLVIAQKTGTQSVARPEIHGVAVKKKGHRVRNTFIGLGAGTAAGLGIGAAQASGCNELLCELAVPIYGLAGLIAGTVTGLVLPTGGWRQIYVP
jgi:hypothetical protein